MQVIDNSAKWKDQYRQDGYKEYLLCGECEDRRQKYEDYMANLINRNIFVKNAKNYTVENLDYKKIKMFHLYNLFLFSACTKPEFYEGKIKIEQKDFYTFLKEIKFLDFITMKKKNSII